MTRARRGLTLLEVMVALVILGLVGTSILEVFGGSVRSAGTAHVWSQAVAFAEEGMERTKLAAVAPGAVASPERLPGGFARQIKTEPWSRDVARVTVVVSLPGGGTFELSRLVRAGP